MRLGVHIPHLALKEIVNKAEWLNCETIQIFTRNPKSWAGPNYLDSDISFFKESLKKKDISPVAIHLSYLPNFASNDPLLIEKSVQTLISELKWAERLEAPFVVTHPGSHKGDGVQIGIKRIIDSINVAFSFVKNDILLLLETTAKEGNEIGMADEIKEIIEGCNEKERLGVCLDTCHIFAAGYDIVNDLDGVLSTFDKAFGLSRIKLVHLNDSKGECGSRKDRHLGIGEGLIGISGFKKILSHPFFKDMPLILETPKTDLWDDVRNLGIVRKLCNH
ncbi:MAG: deoxyribonuclease IV [bacterium]